ncbi:calcium/sodium antiporter [Crassaminicella thermophila]|uniref:Calcium/sodium antiporter n=1 Tax=Crassaminicella thermophila TaxID=2599308 RepID=A0A5C0SG31_CRATE|nr:calcium/sodium antiporter [Crassaminicella thermophila]QEK13515.1 calcium/sodium antiporter [Crassaminicella thermophila]
MTYFILILGFVLLIKGADYFVDAASNIASILRISPILIGLTIVAFGTSSPEAAVSIRAAMKGNNGIALGNVIGSNMFNMSLVVGITAFINPLKVEKETVRKEIPFTLLSSVLLLIVMMDIRLQAMSSNQLTRGDGLVLLSFFTIFLYYLFEVARNSKEKNDEEKNPLLRNMRKNIIFTVGGLTAIVLGGELVVKSSKEIAYSLGMSETLVGLSIAAVGTSLPEMITCITAAAKKHSDIAVGNIVGSNIFNILFVLGTSSVISPIYVEEKIFIDVLFMIVYTSILLIFSRTYHKVSRLEGAILFLSYILYAIYIIIRR